MRSTHMRFRRSALTALGIGIWIFTAGMAHAFSGGITGFSGKIGTTCNSCHSGVVAPVVTLTGPTTLGVGAIGNYTLTLLPAAGNGLGGLDVSASSGLLSNNPAGTRIAVGEITHSAPNNVPPAGIIWNFSWTAPATAGNQTLYSAVSSNDGDGGTGGDGTAATSLVVAVTALNQAPIARIVGPMTAVAGAVVTFSGSTSSDPDGTIVGYDWNFGDGSPGAGASVSHTYTAGTYTVTLTVMDNAGATNSATQTITVSPAGIPQPPVANPGGPYNGAVGTPVQFNGSGSSDPDGSITTYLWNFGDGASASTVSPAHAYAAAGTYTVQLTVTDNSGLTGSAQTTVTVVAVTQQPPVANPGGPYNGTVGTPVQFNGSGSSDPDGSITAYLWNFGDGASASTVSPAHAYAAAGTYTVRLTVTDNSGLTGSAQTTVTIAAAPPVGDGAVLYQSYCSSCHGPGGRGGPAGSVVGENAKDITEAIAEEPTMRFLSLLTTAQIASIGSYLSNGDEKDKKDKKKCRKSKKGENDSDSKCERKHKKDGRSKNED